MSTPNQNPNNQDNPKRPSFTQYLPLVLIALLITMVFNYVYSSMTSASMNEITYTEFLGMLNNGELDSVQIQSDRILILSKEEAEKPAAEQQIYYTALIPNLELTGLTQAMSAKDVDYSGKIVEKGGLKNLRAAIAKAHGSMEISSAPAFVLYIEIPKGES